MKFVFAQIMIPLGFFCAINIDKFLYNNNFQGKIIKDLPRYKDINDDLKNKR